MKLRRRVVVDDDQIAYTVCVPPSFVHQTEASLGARRYYADPSYTIPAPSSRKSPTMHSWRYTMLTIDPGNFFPRTNVANFYEIPIFKNLLSFNNKFLKIHLKKNWPRSSWETKIRRPGPRHGRG